MFTKRDLVLGQEYFGFLLLSICDLFLTGYIFRNGGMEANGLPAWILKNWGLMGLALFKFGMVMFLIIICEVIAMFNIQRARFVILGGCAVYVLVVLYECVLIFQNIDKPMLHPDPPPSPITQTVPPHVSIDHRFHLA
jgi:hypothetical protein